MELILSIAFGVWYVISALIFCHLTKGKDKK